MLGQAQGDYLSAILRLHQRRGYARQADIARELHLSAPTVCVAVKRLQQKGLVELGENAEPFLTPDGQALAEALQERKRLFTEILTSLGVRQEQAEADACRMEHAVSDEGFAAIKRWVCLTMQMQERLILLNSKKGIKNREKIDEIGVKLPLQIDF